MSTPTITSVASDYLARGWSIVPIPYGKKRPILEDWPKLRIGRETIPNYFRNGQNSNIGVILGQPSHGLVDVDLDCAEAVDIAPRFLPETNAVFGRASKPASHFLFRVEGVAPTKKFVDPVTDDTLVELRGDGGQTVFPASVHETGEEICWVTNDEPAIVEYDRLLASVKLIAARVVAERYGDGTQTDDPATWLPALANAPETARRVVAAWIGTEQPRETPKARDWAPVAEDDDGEEDYIRRALDAVPADDRDTWMRFGAALHDSGHSWARDAWDDWSRRSCKYDARDQETTWRSFSRDYSGQRVTVASIIDAARRNVLISARS